MQIWAYVLRSTVQDLDNRSCKYALARCLRAKGIPVIVGEDQWPIVLPEHGILKRGPDLVDAYCFIFEGCGPIYGSFH